jgi:DNA-binding MarR family transcriptional regulator/GNAT superfamily N-acetyltransferase
MQQQAIDKVRDFNRFYTTMLGVVNNHILEGDYTFTEARIIYEAGKQQAITASAIKENLRLDEGYLSRIVAKLVKQGIFGKKRSEEDKRLFTLSLTTKGKVVFSEIDRQSNGQIKSLVQHLSISDQERLAALLKEAKQLLTPGDTQNNLQATNVDFKIAQTSADFEDAKSLFKEYAASLDFDLSFQGFEKELATIGKQYRPPRGALLLCYYEDEQAVGCAGVRELSETVAELKRLYVKSEYRSLKIGKQLLERAIDTARKLQYHYIRLDTVPGQEKAQALYHRLGFYKIKAYRHNPIAGTVYMEKKLIE